MDGYGTTTRRTVTTSPPPSESEFHDGSKDSSNNGLYTLSFSWPFNFPSTPESAAIRILRNIQKLSLYYTIFIWTVLFITLVPARKVSVIYLVIMTEVTFLYFLLLRAVPNSTVLHKIIDKKFVLFVLFVITVVELILTDAGIHLFATLAATIPIVILHAVLTKTEEAAIVNENVGEMTPLVQEKSVGEQTLDLV